MKNCHVCNFECEDNAELCPVCGAVLTGEANPEAFFEREGIEPVLLTSFEDLISAEIFMDVLTDNKIPYSQPQQDDMKIVFGGGFATAEIYVDKKDYDQARELLDEFLASESELELDFDEDFDDEL